MDNIYPPGWLEGVTERKGADTEPGPEQVLFAELGSRILLNELIGKKRASIPPIHRVYLDKEEKVGIP